VEKNIRNGPPKKPVTKGVCRKARKVKRKSGSEKKHGKGPPQWNGGRTPKKRQGKSP